MNVAVLLLALGAGVGPRPTPGMSWHVSADNDYLNFWQCPACRPDYGYTHGLEISLHTSRIPHALDGVANRLGAGPGATAPRMVVALRQEIYTSWRETGDRPFAGWLELAIGVQRETPRSLRSVALRVGVTGPPSLADRTQEWFHRAFGFPPGRDWSHQIPFEPGVGIEYGSEHQLVAIGGARAVGARAGPAWRARLGTIRTDLSIGGRAVIGHGPPPPWRRADGASATRWSFYLIAGADAAAIARDEFLDGALFRSGPHIDKRWLVPEGEWGAGLRVDRLRLEWRATRRGKEFDGQPTPHTFSTLAISLLPAPTS